MIQMLKYFFHLIVMKNMTELRNVFTAQKTLSPKLCPCRPRRWSTSSNVTCRPYRRFCIATCRKASSSQTARRKTRRWMCRGSWVLTECHGFDSSLSHADRLSREAERSVIFTVSCSSTSQGSQIVLCNWSHSLPVLWEEIAVNKLSFFLFNSWRCVSAVSLTSLLRAEECHCAKVLRSFWIRCPKIFDWFIMTSRKQWVGV